MKPIQVLNRPAGLLSIRPARAPSRGRAALVAAVLGLSLAAAAPAFGHAEHGQPQHGGVVAEAGVFQGELVTQARGVTLYLTNHGQPVATAGATAKMTVLAGGQKSEVTLAPAGDNRLEPTASTPLPPGAKAVATVKLPDGRSGALRFELK